jgi:hypothetical protein
VRRPDGSLAAAPAGFARLRDRSGDPREVFAILERAGAKRRDLQLAWDFTTRSDEWATKDMLRVRELVRAWLAANRPTVMIESVTEGEEKELWRTVRGTITGPLFLASATPGALLHRADGAVAQNGTAAFPFLVTVPVSVKGRMDPGRAVLYGHGFFGGRGELLGESARKLLDRLGAVGFAVDWQGMSVDDVAGVSAKLAAKPSEAWHFTDRLHQAMANWMVFAAAVRGPLRDVAGLQRPMGARRVYDDAVLHFIGLSQGSILGGTLAGLHPDLERVVLQVGGAAFITHIAPRARPFRPFQALIQLFARERIDQIKYIATLQPHFDRIDPASYAERILARPLDGATPRRVLLQIGLGDAQVPHLAGFFHARLLGIPLLDPSPIAVPGLETKAGPLDSALALYRFSVDPWTAESPEAPEEGNEVHDALRLLPSAQAQIDRFLRDGAITNPCTGPCDPE